MKKLIFALVALSFLSGVARADELMAYRGYASGKPIYACRLSGHLYGVSSALGVGVETMQGPGIVRCIHRTTHKRVRIPVTMTVSGSGNGLGFTAAQGIRVITGRVTTDNPANFMDTFYLGASDGTALAAARIRYVQAARATRDDGYGFELGFRGREILGLRPHLFYGLTLVISAR